MKKILLMTMLAFIATISSAQLVISEISYNPPESGTDSLEYIELYNSTTSEIDLTGYIITDNSVSDTLASGMIAAEGYVVLAPNVVAIQEILGLTALAIPNVALNNSGEPLSVHNPNGNVIDMVEYSDKAPWPTFAEGTDGQGATVELCTFDGDSNNGANWKSSTNDLGITINDKLFLGTPGTVNSVTCEAQADHIVQVSSNQFTPKDLVINVGETVRWTNLGGNHNVNGSQSTYSNNPEGFGNGAPSTSDWTYDFTFNTEGVYDYQCDPHIGFGMVGTVTVEGEVINSDLIDISVANQTNSDGVATLLGDTVKVVGVVHGENLNPSGHQYFIVDVANVEGIGIFGDKPLGYNYAEGDMIEVIGVVAQYNGLTQINPFTMTYMSSDNELMDPIITNALSEDTESLLTRIENVSFVDATEWPGNGSSFNIDITDGVNTYTLRIDGDSQLSTMSVPTGFDYIQGMGGQFDGSSPFLDGYQLFPRSMEDFGLLSSNNDLSDEGDITISPNPSVGDIYIDTDININYIKIYSVTGQLIMSIDYNNRIDLTSLNSGIYLVKFIRDDKSTIRKVVIK